MHRGQAKTSPEVIFCVQGVISPLLANAYLHYVLDLWAERWRRREAKGDMVIVRYADDAIFGFESETDARRFLDA
ncbi:MAG TPA: reverse transcriptase domain-containing protein, partial [Pseudomonas sp.]